MTRKEMKQLRRIITLVASKREAAGLNFNDVCFGIKGNVCHLKVWCTNSAYKHELNALMMSVEGFGFCSCYQTVDEDYNIVWECY